MIQKDYIMRIIEQLGKILAKVLINKNEGETEEALSTIDTAFKNILGLDSQLFDTLSDAFIAEVLGISKDKSTASMKCIVAARLLKEKADILKQMANSNQAALSYYQKALRLYRQGMLNIGYNELDLTSYYADIKQITDQLGNSIPNDLLYQMKNVYKQFEAHNKAGIATKI
jgi:hypothetical protein